MEVQEMPEVPSLQGTRDLRELVKRGEEIRPSTLEGDSDSNQVNSSTDWSQHTGVMTVSTPPTSVHDSQTSPKRQKVEGSTTAATYVNGDLSNGMHREQNTVPSASGTAGHKRTASGDIKSPNDVSSLKVSSPKTSSHSRTTSKRSNGSAVSEMSAELRARLSYAMVKVQNGWQTHSIDEVESMASRQSSPRTNASDGMAIHSPTIPRDSKSPLGTINPDPKRILNPSKGASTHAASWQDHRNSAAARVLEAQQISDRLNSQVAADTGIGPAKLAPPVDIVPAKQARRSQFSGERQPPRLSTNLSGDTSSSRSHDSPSVAHRPSTPPGGNSQHRDHLIRTPSQKRAMEQDAVETLLFMSSPNNSQNPRSQPSTQYHRGSPPNSALSQSQSSQNRNLNAHPPVETQSRLNEIIRPTNYAFNSKSQTPVDDNDLDRRIDEMSDESFSDAENA